MPSKAPVCLVVALAGLAFALMLGVLGCTSVEEAAPAASSPTATTAPTNTTPAPSTAETAAAAREARKAGEGLRVASLRRSVGPQKASGGWSLWSFRAADGHPAHMILGPDGHGTTWTGCRPAFSIVDRCGGAAEPPSTLVLAGRTTPAVASVVVITRSGARRAAVVGDGGWLYYTDAIPTTQEASPEDPRSVEALDRSGAILKRIGIAP